MASFRSGVAALVLLVALPAARRHVTWRAAMVGLAYAVTLTLFVLANRLTTSANAIYLQTTAPLFLLLLGPWVLKEPIRGRDVPILLAVVTGMVLVFIGRDAPSTTATNPALGNLLAVLSGAAYALMLCGLRWLGRDTSAGGEGLSAVVLGNIFACVGALPMALPLVDTPVTAWGVILYLGAFQIGLAYVLVTAGLRQVPALEASLILLVETALNPVWTWLLLAERPTGWALAGGAVVIGATVLQALRQRPTSIRAAVP